ncbi:MAG: hypothetical protein JWP02_1506 [Acidimicrobiales bacterium]|nr:hypothetical protein [Acidimicrobiales bacterium]
MRPIRFASPDRQERTTLRGPNPATVFEVGAIDVLYGRAMAGHNGARIIGEHSSSSVKASGELGPHQSFKGGVLLAAHAADRKGFNTALPNTHGPIAQPNAVLDTMGRALPRL